MKLTDEQIKNITNKYIVIEGVDRSGKTTAVNYIYDILKDNNVKVVKVATVCDEEDNITIREKILSESLKQSERLALLCYCHIRAFNKIFKLKTEGYTILQDRSLGSFYALNILSESDGELRFQAEKYYQLLLSHHYVIPDKEVLIKTMADDVSSRLELGYEKVNYLDLKHKSDIYKIQYGHEYYLKNKSTAFIKTTIHNTRSLEHFKEDVLNTCIYFN